MSAVIRLAADDDMPGVGKLFRDASYPDQLVDWTRPHLAPYWLVAEQAGEIVGAVQVVADQPYGFIGEIVVHPSVKGRRADGAGAPLSATSGSVAGELYVAAVRVLRHAGVQIVYGFVSDELKGLQRVMRRYATDLGPGRLFGLRGDA